ncbi:hypothetical protein A464_2357 [Salmonella bongori N268-08]|uniref:Uncharacterized protein n=1 Tax=Salmonella bongori N268-08 TaxID=1197719 RepID=S5NH28_SALBN|nr:hypothetical protein A464_2357 [Salmonella bongori N268-08]
MQGNLVDIQTHDKLSFKTGQYSTTACQKTQADRPVISGVIRNANDLGDKNAEKKLLLR